MNSQNGKAAIEEPLVSFCMSTYKRPVFLRRQLEIIAEQTFKKFQVIVSDNDPEGSGKKVVEDFNDPRVNYFLNETNLGMVKSFNRSLERANSTFVVMITDDDPVYPDMLERLLNIAESYPGFPIYCGCNRSEKPEGEVEVFDKDNFLFQLLNPRLTVNFLWSSCLLRRDVAQEIGGIPDYASPHLADHAMLALCSKDKGGVMINRIYGELASHDSNFSKGNFELYYTGCIGFYNTITGTFKESDYKKNGKDALALHLESWFLVNTFNLKKYFAHKRKDHEVYKNASFYLKKILALPFMRNVYPKYILNSIIFYIKYPLWYVKYALISRIGKT